MPTFLSDQYTNEVASPQTFSKSYDMGPTIKKDFTFTVPAGTAAADIVQLASLPKGAVLLGGKLANDGTGNNVTIGDSVNGAAVYLASTAMGSTEIFFGNTIALGYRNQLAVAVILTATITTGAWTAGKVVKGYVEYRLGG